MHTLPTISNTACNYRRHTDPVQQHIVVNSIANKMDTKTIGNGIYALSTSLVFAYTFAVIKYAKPPGRNTFRSFTEFLIESDWWTVSPFLALSRPLSRSLAPPRHTPHHHISRNAQNDGIRCLDGVLRISPSLAILAFSRASSRSPALSRLISRSVDTNHNFPCGLLKTCFFLISPQQS